MFRHHLSIFVLAGTLAGLALLLPASIAHYWAWYGALAKQRSKLDGVVVAVARRSMRLFDKAAATLGGLQALRTDHECAPQTVAQLVAATIATREIDEIGLYRDGRIHCSSWGRTDFPLSLEGVSQLPDSHLQLQPAGYSQANPKARLVGLYDGALYAYVEPGRLSDVALPPQAQLFLFAGQEQLLAAKEAGDLALARQAAQHAGEGMLQLSGYLFERLSHGGLRIVAAVPMQQVHAGASQAKRSILPATVLASAAGVLAVMLWLRRRLSLAGELRRAITLGELIVHYQPIIELASGRCAGAEALVRWRHPRGDWIPADVIIAKAERHGLVGRITELVIRRVMEELGDALRQHPAMHVSINLAAQDMRANGPLCLLESLLDGSGVAHRQFWLEVTERGFVDAASACVALAALRRQGCQVAIDDFGTGFSSLAYLQSLPLDVLKVDKAFVDVIDDKSGTAVTDHILAMARSLGLRIVAEGIETANQANYLHARQVQYGQGWLFARAMPLAEFLAYWRQHGSGMLDPGQDERHGR